MADHNIRQLPGTRLAPETVLARNAAYADGMYGVVIVAINKDGTYNVDWSCMKVSEVCMASTMLAESARLLATGQSPENIANMRGPTKE